MPRVKIKAKIIRFIDLTVLTLGEIFNLVVHNYSVINLAMGGRLRPDSPMAETEE